MDQFVNVILVSGEKIQIPLNSAIKELRAKYSSYVMMIRYI